MKAFFIILFLFLQIAALLKAIQIHDLFFQNLTLAGLFILIVYLIWQLIKYETYKDKYY